jgi:hypothetical protein
LDEDELLTEPLLDADSAAHLRTALTIFFQQVIPPKEGLLRDYVFWLHHLIGSDKEALPFEDPSPEKEKRADEDEAEI